MTGYLIDLFFSLSGRANRKQWLLGSLFVAALCLAGIWLFNDASFEESINAAPDVPTMAAVFWALLCLYAFVALSIKRIRDAGYGLGFAATAILPTVLLFVGWGSGLFARPLTQQPDTYALWALIAALIPLLITCANRAEKAQAS